MLPLIDEIYKDFYLNLNTAYMVDFHPDLTEADEIFERIYKFIFNNTSIILLLILDFVMSCKQ